METKSHNPDLTRRIDPVLEAADERLKKNGGKEKPLPRQEQSIVVDSDYQAEIRAKNEAKMTQAEAVKKAREDRFKDPSYVQELTSVFQALQRGELLPDIDRQKLDDIEALIDFRKDVIETMDKGHEMMFDIHTSDVAAQVLTKPKKVVRPRAVDPRGSTRGRQDISPVKPPAPPEKKKGFLARLFG
jgi:hypothetical protein